MADKDLTQFPAELLTENDGPVGLYEGIVEILTENDLGRNVDDYHHIIEFATENSRGVNLYEYLIEVLYDPALHPDVDPSIQTWGSALGDWDGGVKGGAVPDRPGGRLDDSGCECIEYPIFSDCLDSTAIPCD